MPAIIAKNVAKRFGDFQALKGINLSVDEGEFFGMFGPNGAGKTTLTRILTGQLKQDKGKISVLGIPSSDPIGIKAKVGIVPEAENPPTFLTTREFLELVCKIRELDDVETRVDRWIKFFDLGEKDDVLCRDLSKGQKQKVILAAAFIPEPRLLFLDEPFINLDPIFQKRLREYLASVITEGRTIFMCSHILEIAEKLCTRAAIINKGALVAQGTLDEIRSKEGERLEDIFMRLVQE